MLADLWKIRAWWASSHLRFHPWLICFGTTLYKELWKKALGRKPEKSLASSTRFLSKWTSQDSQMWSPSWLPGSTVLGFMETSQPEKIRLEWKENGELVASCLVFLWCGGRSLGSRFKFEPQFQLQPCTSCGIQTSSSTSLCLSFLVYKMGMVIPILLTGLLCTCQALSRCFR